MGQGSRSAMAGPFYDSGQPAAHHRAGTAGVLPRQVVHLRVGPQLDQGGYPGFGPAGRSCRSRIFCPTCPISKPIDFKIGRDGAIYLLEYGNDYFLDNPDARLIRITYSEGNRAADRRVLEDRRNGRRRSLPTAP